ncbi:MAG: small subunit ribosomal protein S6 [Nitriliruptoraceae bacterium]|jgi:small subunit ribosomal protein S6
MRRYEMMLIVSDTLEEDDALAVFDRAKTVLTEQGGEVIDDNWWGKRKFAYEIEKRTHGFYGILDMSATHEAVVELERQLKLRDEVVRFKTIRPELRVKKPSR